MKIGILQCDNIRENLPNSHPNYPSMIESLLRSVQSNLDFVTYPALDNLLPESIDDCDVYITTGSRLSANDDEIWIYRLLLFIQQLYKSEKKLVGICFGHQLMNKALGGLVEQSPKGWGVGTAVITPKIQPSWTDKKSPSTIKLLVSHQDQVIKPAQGSQVLAGNDFCPNAILQINNFLSFQGHPEFSKDYARDLIVANNYKMNKKQKMRALGSLILELDASLMAHWILDFFNNYNK